MCRQSPLLDSPEVPPYEPTVEVQWPLDFTTYIDLVTMNGRARADLYFEMDPLKPDSILQSGPSTAEKKVKSWSNEEQDFLKLACSIRRSNNGGASFVIHHPGNHNSVFATIQRRRATNWHDTLWSDGLGFHVPDQLHHFIQDHHGEIGYSIFTKYGTQTFRPLAATYT